MPGTSPVATWTKPDYTTQTPSAYKANIDGNAAVAQRIVDSFAPRQSNTPAMTVTLDAGHVLVGNTLTEVAAQTTGTITAPVGNPRIDRVVIDNLTGAVSVVTGTPAGSPTAPAIPVGKSPVAQALLQTSSTTITNSMITDERNLSQVGSGSGGYAPTSSLTQIPPGRLTLATGSPITTADQTAKTTIYYTPHVGDLIPIYNGSYFAPTQFTELSLALDSDSGHTGYHQSGKNFDLFVFNDGGTKRLGTGPAWSTDTGRGTGAGTTELELKNGIWTNKVSITLRFGSSAGNTVSVSANQATYVGSFRATANGQAEDSYVKRLLFNAYQQVRRAMARFDNTDSWNYSTATWRQANGSASNQIDFLLGLVGGSVSATAAGAATSSTSTLRPISTGIGIDSTTAPATNCILGRENSSNSYAGYMRAHYEDNPGLGYHYLAWLEIGNGTDTQTWYGDGAETIQKNGIVGSLTA